MTTSTAAVLPIKQLANAKQRLSDLLTPEERHQFFSCMVEDVLTAVEATPQIDRVLVVTDDAAVAELAGAYSAEVIPEPSPPGMSAAVTAAGRLLAGEHVGTMLFLPGDLPLITPEELEVVLEGFAAGRDSGAQSEVKPEMLIVPAADLGGSNCIACSPPDCMEFAFGVGSFKRHLEIARSRGLASAVAKLPGIGLDVDTPDDLKRLLEAAPRLKPDCHSIRYLASSGIIDKLSER